MPERRARRGRRLALAAVTVAVGLAVGGPHVPVLAGPTGVVQVPGSGPQIPSDPPASPEETRARAREILSGSEYDPPQQPDESLLERIASWIGDRVPDLDLPGGTSEGSNTASIVLIVVVLAAAIAAVTWVLIGTRGTRRAPDDEAPDAEVDITPLRTAAEWEAEAERLEAAGDHRAAVRARFRSLVAALARRDLVADTPGRTAGELRDDVAVRAPLLAPAFDASADQFERVWFGGAEAGPADSTTARDLAARALDAAPRRAPATPEGDA